MALAAANVGLPPQFDQAPGIWSQNRRCDVRVSSNEAHNLSTSEWTDAVSGALPYLDADDMRKALQIFDRAMINLQQAKDVRQILDACTKDDARSAPNPLKAMMLSLQQERQLLFRDFQQLLDQKIADVCDSEGPMTERSPMAQHMPCRGTEFALQVRCGKERIKPPAMPTVDLEFEQGAVLIPSAREGAATGHPPKFEPVPDQESAPLGAVSVFHSEAKCHPHGKRVQNAHASIYKANKSISSILTTLSSKDPNELFIVRRIGQLGYKAERILKNYFAQFGGVVRVFIANSTARDRNVPHGEVRSRQGSLGFVQMDSAKAVEQVLANNVEHKVNDVLIRVQRFQSQQHAIFEDGFYRT